MKVLQFFLILHFILGFHGGTVIAGEKSSDQVTASSSSSFPDADDEEGEEESAKDGSIASPPSSVLSVSEKDPEATIGSGSSLLKSPLASTSSSSVPTNEEGEDIAESKVEEGEDKVTAAEVESELKKISGLIVQINIMGGKAAATGFGSAFIINEAGNHISIMTAAHIFRNISRDPQKIKARPLWFFIPDSEIADSFSLGIGGSKLDLVIASLKGVKIEDPNTYKDKLFQVYKREAPLPPPEQKKMEAGRILSAEDEEIIKKKIGSSLLLGSFPPNWLLLTKVIFPAYSKKKRGTPLWDVDDDIVMAQGTGTWGQSQKKESKEESDDDMPDFSDFEFSKDPLKKISSLKKDIIIKQFKNKTTFKKSYFNSYSEGKIFYSYGYPDFNPEGKTTGIFMQGVSDTLEVINKKRSFLFELPGSKGGSSGSLISILYRGTLKIVGVISGGEIEGKPRVTFLTKSYKQPALMKTPDSIKKEGS